MKTPQQKVTPRLKTVLLWGGMFFGGYVAVYAAVYASGFRLVTTPSVPVGVYRVTQEEVKRGAYVAVCLPKEIVEVGKARGYLPFGLCDGWVQPVIKQVGAVRGDWVAVEEWGVEINGWHLANSEVLSVDSKGRALVHVEWGHHEVKGDEVWLFSTYRKNSWDSRYFGAVSIGHILNTAQPVWVWVKE